MSDFYPHGHAADCYGVLRKEGYSERAIFVIDKKGIIRYIDIHDIDEQPDNEVLFRVLAEIEPSGVTAQPAPVPVPEAAPTADVVLYCTPWCPDCRKAEAYLKGKRIEYHKVDVSIDRAAAMDLRGWTGGFETTPTFNIRGEIVVGFDKAKLDKVLKVK